MAKEKRVTLLDPISGHAELIREVVLREPKGSDYQTLSDPFIIARNPDGSVFPVENVAIIQAYLERCVVSPDPLLLAGISLTDAIAVKNALFSFFTEAQARLSATST